MVVKPMYRGFICTTAHPVGCAKSVRDQVIFAKERHLDDKKGPKRVLVIGSSMGYGLAARISAAFGFNADTVGVFYEREASARRTASAGWYNNQAFEAMAKKAGLACPGINGDAFSDEVKSRTIEAIRNDIPGGQVDLIVYSVAAPKRTDKDGVVWASVLKPIGKTFHGKTVDFHTGEVSYTSIEPAAPDEIESTIKVMGSDDWILWINAMSEAGVIAPGAATLAFTYIGPSFTYDIYWNGTIGKAKEDLERGAKDIDKILSPMGGKAFVVALKGLVTQSSAAIPIVPLYISFLYKLMKERGTHENCIGQITRLFSDRLYQNGIPGDWGDVPVDEAGRVRMDDFEVLDEIQDEILRLWDKVDSSNIDELTDIDGYRSDFFAIFGFGFDGVDYEADVDTAGDML